MSPATDRYSCQTYIGHVLISVNPFKQIKGIYDERTLKDYRGKYPYEVPPHVYALTDNMYREMLAEGASQCVIIRCDFLLRTMLRSI